MSFADVGTSLMYGARRLDHKGAKDLWPGLAATGLDFGRGALGTVRPPLAECGRPRLPGAA